MKHIHLIISLFILGFLNSCQNEYQQPDTVVDYAIYSSFFRGAPNTLNAAVNTYMNVTDLSQGALTHQWNISDGCSFIEGVQRLDTVFTKYIVPGTTSTKKTIAVLFTKGGMQSVHLYDTFPDSVSFRGTTIVPAKKVGNVWVMDTTIVVHVYDILVPQYKITQDGTDVAANKDTIFIKQNNSLVFTDLTVIGEPTGRYWNVATNSSSVTPATITFKNIGIFTGTFTATRTGNTILNIPSGNVKVIIPTIFKVIP